MVRTDQIHYGLKKCWANEQEINVMDNKLKVNINHTFHKVASVLIHFSREFCSITKPACAHKHTHLPPVTATYINGLETAHDKF